MTLGIVLMFPYIAALCGKSAIEKPDKNLTPSAAAKYTLTLLRHSVKIGQDNRGGVQPERRETPYKEISMNEGSKKKELSNSVDNACKLLSCFSDSEQIGISELARNCSLSKATVSRLIASLEKNGFVMKNRFSGKYELGLSFLIYGSYARERNVLANSFDEALRNLAKKYNATAHLAAMVNNDLIILNKISEGAFIYMSSRIGGSLDAYATATGKCILAYSSAQEIERYVAGVSFVKKTEKTITSTEALYDELYTIRRRGYALDDGETHDGLFCVAAPVLDVNEKPIAAISVSGRKEILAPIVEEIAADIMLEIKNVMR